MEFQNKVGRAVVGTGTTFVLLHYVQAALRDKLGRVRDEDLLFPNLDMNSSPGVLVRSSSKQYTVSINFV